MKQCNKCGDELTDVNWYPSSQKSRSYTCKNCLNISGKKWDKENPGARQKICRKWRSENPEQARTLRKAWAENQRLTDPKKYRCRLLRASCATRAAKKGLPFNLTAKYIETIAPDTCPVFGVPLHYEGGEKQKNTASVDRIVPELGYVKGNVQIISCLANSMKSNAAPHELAQFARWVESTQQLKVVESHYGHN